MALWKKTSSGQGDPPGPLGKYITMYNKAVKTLGTDNPEVLKNFFASQQYGQNNTQIQQNNNINKAPQPKESKIGNVAGDIGTLALSTLQNFGMNIPGDVIKTVAPKAAILDVLPQTTTNQYVKQRNQSLGQNIKDIGDATNTVAAFEVGTPLVMKGVQQGVKYLKPVVESGIDAVGKTINNTYKVNPWRFKPNPNAYYRGIGEDGLKDAIESGLFRSPTMRNSYKGMRKTNETYWANAKNFNVAKRASVRTDGSIMNGKSVIAEYPKDDKIAIKYRGSNNAIDNYATQEALAINKGRILKQHWLKGYKEVPKFSKEQGINIAKNNATIENAFINPQYLKSKAKGFFRLYPKGKPTEQELSDYIKSDYFKSAYTGSFKDDIQKFMIDRAKLGDRSGLNKALYGGRNWNGSDYLMLGTFGGAYPLMTGIYGLAFSPTPVKNKVLNNLGVTDRDPLLMDNDTVIDLTNRKLSYAKVNEASDGTVILGGEFIENNANTVRKAKDFIKTSDSLLGDKKIPLSKIKSFYGVEDGKLKIGMPHEFKEDTEIVPMRFGNSKIQKAVLNGKEMRLLDMSGKPIYQNIPNTGKAILYSPSTKNYSFIFNKTGKSGVDKVNSFIQKNKDGILIHMDNGRYEFYGVNKDGLDRSDFVNYYDQDYKRKGTPGYNIVVK